MNAREHYEIAEQLLASCQTDPGDELNAPVYPAQEDGVNSCGNALLAGLTHAVLALAATHGADQSPFDELLPPPVD
jgi:hypothetical protein